MALLARLLVAVPTVAWTSTAGAPCQSSSISIDVAQSDTTLIAFGGRSWGQVLEIPQARLSSVTAWLPAFHGSISAAMHLFIAQTDTSGIPIPGLTLVDGPILNLETGDGVNPTPCRFVFDVPVALPRGRYCFAIKEDLCGAAFHLLAESRGNYSQGTAWEFGPNWNCYGLGGIEDGGHPGVVMNISVELCDTSVPAHATSWGRLKLRYR